MNTKNEENFKYLFKDAFKSKDVKMANTILSKTDKKIIKIVEKAEKPISKTEIAKRAKLSIATVSKYVDVLAAKKILKVIIYSSIHLVTKEDTDGF